MSLTSAAEFITAAERADNPLERITALTEAAAAIAHALEDEVAFAVDSRRTWTEIGAAMGTSRQVAHQRYGPRRPPATKIADEARVEAASPAVRRRAVTVTPGRLPWPRVHLTVESRPAARRRLSPRGS